MLCPNCEAENRDDAKFCDECGFPLSGSLARLGGGASPVDSAPVRGGERVFAGGSAFDDLDRDLAEPPFYDGLEPQADTIVFDDGGSVEPDHAAAPDDGTPGDFEPSGKTMAFDDVDSEPEPEASTSGDWGDDPFAGYSQSIDEQEFGFKAPENISAAAIPGQGGDWGQHTMQMPRVDQAARPKARDFRISTPGQEKGRKRIVAVVAAGIIVGIAVAALVTYLLGFWGGIAVPDVTGMTESDARTVLEGDGFSVRSTQIKSDDTEGLVVVMDPAAGSRAGEGSEVVIHISTARFVPDVAGKSEDEAKALLAESGYENIRIEKVKSEDAEGIVLAVNPEAGTRAKSNAEIVVSVSEPYSVPDISGLDLEAAEQAIVDSGLTYGVVYVDTDQYEDGTIIGTDPEQGTKVEKDSYVAINVARKRGAELVALTQSMFAPGSTVDIGGVEYEVQSLDAVSYEGDDVVSFTMTGLPRTTFFGKTIYADQQVVSGQVAYSESNEVLSIA